MELKRIHHVAYRCRDAKETVEFYQRVLNMEFTVAFAEDRVPSTKEPDPYMHVFLDAGMGNVLAFFELPTRPEMGRDENTPEWVQHIAFELEDYDALLAAKKQVEAEGIDAWFRLDPAELLGEEIASVPAADIPGFTGHAVAGHHAVHRSFRTPNGRTVLALGARQHFYQSRDASTVAHAVRMAAAAGCTQLVVTNGCGFL